MICSLSALARGARACCVRHPASEPAAIAWPLLGARLGAEVVVKHENHQPIGAFKVRGGLTYVDALRRREPNAKGLISATRGNHGQSLAFAVRRFGLEVDDRRPARQFAREERRHAGAWRGADRVRTRLPGSARGGHAARRRARAARRALLPPRSCAWRLDLRARTFERASRSRHALCSRSARARESAVASRRATRSA